MITIHKYPIKPGGLYSIDMPEGAKILTLQTQGEDGCIWALVDTDKPIIRKHYLTVGTGQELEPNIYEKTYIGTFQLMNGRFILHVFQV